MSAKGDKRPVEEDDYQRVWEPHALGMGRNAIAREIGRAQRTVSVTAAELAALHADIALDLHEWCTRGAGGEGRKPRAGLWITGWAGPVRRALARE